VSSGSIALEPPERRPSMRKRRSRSLAMGGVKRAEVILLAVGLSHRKVRQGSRRSGPHYPQGHQAVNILESALVNSFRWCCRRSLALPDGMGGCTRRSPSPFGAQRSAFGGNCGYSIENSPIATTLISHRIACCRCSRDIATDNPQQQPATGDAEGVACIRPSRRR
jgi:hypothetical protein